jgi:hypothetical protein
LHQVSSPAGIDAESEGVAIQPLAVLVIEGDDRVPRVVPRRVRHCLGLRPDDRHTIMTLRGRVPHRRAERFVNQAPTGDPARYGLLGQLLID